MLYTVLLIIMSIQYMYYVYELRIGLIYGTLQLRTEGIRGFFKGFAPIALRAWPANAVSTYYLYSSRKF